MAGGIAGAGGKTDRPGKKHEKCLEEAGGNAPSLLERLGLHGLQSFDAPILAALATQAPLLLIGPHGSAKSLLLERLAQGLNLEHRHYNASLLSFDDLIGFPVPDGDGLRYLKTPGTLWDAQSVLLDEISRCRPEVQNKLFSIVHERRVQGIALANLRYRWAAMNPPARMDTPEDAQSYEGSFSLDPALADRFAFVIELPGLEDLGAPARESIIAGGIRRVCPATGADRSEFDGLAELVEATRLRIGRDAGLHGAWIQAYVAAAIAPLAQARLPISGRRAATLAGNILAVAAASVEVGGAIGLADAALVALRCSLPHRAQGIEVPGSVIATVHRQAAEAADSLGRQCDVQRILSEAGAVRRVGMALAALEANPRSVSRDTMSLLVSDALAAQTLQGRWILAQQLLPNVAELDCVDTPTLELMSSPFLEQVRHETRDSLMHEVARNQVRGFNELVAGVAALDATDPAQAALANLGATLYATDAGAARPGELLGQLGAIQEDLREGKRRFLEEASHEC